MSPIARPVQTYPCPCGQTHEPVMALAGLPVIECPEYQDRALTLAKGRTHMIVGVKEEDEPTKRGGRK